MKKHSQGQPKNTRIISSTSRRPEENLLRLLTGIIPLPKRLSQTKLSTESLLCLPDSTVKPHTAFLYGIKAAGGKKWCLNENLQTISEKQTAIRHFF